MWVNNIKRYRIIEGGQTLSEPYSNEKRLHSVDDFDHLLEGSSELAGSLMMSDSNNTYVLCDEES